MYFRRALRRWQKCPTIYTRFRQCRCGSILNYYFDIAHNPFWDLLLIGIVETRHLIGLHGSSTNQSKTDRRLEIVDNTMIYAAASRDVFIASPLKMYWLRTLTRTPHAKIINNGQKVNVAFCKQETSRLANSPTIDAFYTSRPSRRSNIISRVTDFSECFSVIFRYHSRAVIKICNRSIRNQTFLRSNRYIHVSINAGITNEYSVYHNEQNRELECWVRKQGITGTWTAIPSYIYFQVCKFSFILFAENIPRIKKYSSRNLDGRSPDEVDEILFYLIILVLKIKERK